MKKLLLATVATFPLGLSAQNALANNYFDPCLSMRSDFHAERNMALAAYNTEIANVDTMALTPEYREVWIKAKKTDLRPHFDEHVAPTLKDAGQTDMEGAFTAWSDKKIAEAGGDMLITAHFRQELKAYLLEERSATEANYAAQKRELDESCKMDAGNQAHRAASKLIIDGITSPIAAPVAVIKSIDRNIQGASRESGEIDKVLKGATGISVKDIKNHGVFGGPNSVFRKPFG
ncbi:MAG: hypothetical protein AAFX81_21190 [Pseudomonadota bacterium]